MIGVVQYLKVLAIYVTFGVVLSVATLLVALSLATVQSFYDGDWVTRPGYRTSATAEVLNCVRTGPVATNGFGFWWRCNIAVELTDGRSVTTNIGNSVVTPDDRGKKVEVVEFCRHDGHRDCSYARPGSVILTLAVGLLQILKMAIMVCGFALAAGALLVGLLGSKGISLFREGMRGVAKS